MQGRGCPIQTVPNRKKKSMSNEKNKEVKANAVVAVSYNHSKFEELTPKGVYLVIDCRETGGSANPKTNSASLAKRYGKHYGLVPALSFRALERPHEWLMHAVPAAAKLAELAAQTPIALIGWNTAHLKAVAQLVAKASSGAVKPILEWEMNGKGGRSLVRTPTDEELAKQMAKFLYSPAMTKPLSFAAAKLLD